MSLLPERYNVACRSGSICFVINRQPVSESRSSWLYISNKDQSYITYTFTSPLCHFVLILNDEVLLLILLGVCLVSIIVFLYIVLRLTDHYLVNMNIFLQSISIIYWNKTKITKGLMHNYLHKSIYLSMCL